MTDTETPDKGPPHATLYITDAELIRRLGYSPKRGYRVLKSLDRGIPQMRRYPQPDPLFCNRRFWPAVLQWHMDYHHARAPIEPHGAPSVQPRWQENFDAPPDKARRPEHARAALPQA
jgi:hypothetical protein